MDKEQRAQMIALSEAERAGRLANGILAGGLRKNESIIDYLTDEEQNKIDYISGVYDPIFTITLIDKTDSIINGRTDQRPIKYPYKYIEAIKEKYF